jgi:hypothetical protein
MLIIFSLMYLLVLIWAMQVDWYLVRFMMIYPKSRTIIEHLSQELHHICEQTRATHIFDGVDIPLGDFIKEEPILEECEPSSFAMIK